MSSSQLKSSSSLSSSIPYEFLYNNSSLLQITKKNKTDKKYMTQYILQVIYDLSVKSTSSILSNKIQVSKQTFMEYFNTPLYLLERIYMISFDKTNRKERLDYEEVRNGFTALLLNLNKENLVKFIFEVYDTNDDGYISMSDIDILLRNVISYEDQVNNEGDIDDFIVSHINKDKDLYMKVVKSIKHCFDIKEKESISIDDYYYIVKYINSDILLIVIYYLERLFSYKILFYIRNMTDKISNINDNSLFDKEDEYMRNEIYSNDLKLLYKNNYLCRLNVRKISKYNSNSNSHNENDNNTSTIKGKNNTLYLNQYNKSTRRILTIPLYKNLDLNSNSNSNNNNQVKSNQSNDNNENQIGRTSSNFNNYVDLSNKKEDYKLSLIKKNGVIFNNALIFKNLTKVISNRIIDVDVDVDLRKGSSSSYRSPNRFEKVEEAKEAKENHIKLIVNTTYTSRNTNNTNINTNTNIHGKVNTSLKFINKSNSNTNMLNKIKNKIENNSTLSPKITNDKQLKIKKTKNLFKFLKSTSKETKKRKESNENNLPSLEELRLKSDFNQLIDNANASSRNRRRHNILKKNGGEDVSLNTYNNESKNKKNKYIYSTSIYENTSMKSIEVIDEVTYKNMSILKQSNTNTNTKIKSNSYRKESNPKSNIGYIREYIVKDKEIKILCNETNRLIAYKASLIKEGYLLLHPYPSYTSYTSSIRLKNEVMSINPLLFLVFSLVNCFLKEEDSMKIEGKDYNSFSIHHSYQKIVFLYNNSNNSTLINWNEHIKSRLLLQNQRNFKSSSFKNESFLGKGKFSQVIHVKTEEKSYAFKILNKKMMDKMDLFSTRKEILIMKHVSSLRNNENNSENQDESEESKGIIDYFTYYETYKSIYIQLEYFNSQNLYQFLVQRKFILKEDTVRRIIKKILMSIRFLYENHIVHRDLKPENILIKTSSSETKAETDFSIKVIDFGLARFLSINEKIKNEPFGTLTYAAPEIIQNKDYDSSVDMYSLGVISFFLLSKSLPFLGKTEQEIASKIIKGEYSFQKEKWRHVSMTGVDFCRRLIVKEAYKRMSVIEALDHGFVKGID